VILEEAIVRVKKAAKQIQLLEGAVRHRLEPRAAQGRQIPIVFTQSFVFTPTVVRDELGVVSQVSLPMQLVQQPIVNGAEDCYLKEASYTAYFLTHEEPDLGTFEDEEAVDFPNVLSSYKRLSNGNTNTFQVYMPAFNFQWNARLMSTQANYLSQANNAQLLSRRSLGHASRGVRRQLYSSLPFKAGDALLLSVQPTYWGLPIMGRQNFPFDPAQQPAVQLTISLFGTRGPDMVELAEDADLEP
jgi:hypothetical protein